MGLVYKTSFDKANRTSLSGKRGVGLDVALPIFADLRKELGLPLMTDIHAEETRHRRRIHRYPANPGLSLSADRSADRRREDRRVVNVKKGQFLAPWDMTNVVAKITARATRTCW